MNTQLLISIGCARAHTYTPQHFQGKSHFYDFRNWTNCRQWIKKSCKRDKWTDRINISNGESNAHLLSLRYWVNSYWPQATANTVTAVFYSGSLFCVETFGTIDRRRPSTGWTEGKQCYAFQFSMCMRLWFQFKNANTMRIWLMLHGRSWALLNSFHDENESNYSNEIPLQWRSIHNALFMLQSL